MLTITQPGMLTLIEDRGRRGHLSSGVGAAGVYDRLSAARANHAVGNLPEAAVFEVLMGGLEFSTSRPILVAVTGASLSITRTRADGSTSAHATGDVLRLGAGDRIALGMATRGLRAYVAVQGGVDCEPVLGSRSADLLSGIGPKKVEAGEEIPIGRDTAPGAFVPLLTHLPPVWDYPEVISLTMIPGPRADWFPEETLNNLSSHVFTVSDRSNRIGVRVTGDPLTRSRHDELPSEGMVRGSIQVPPDGLPVLFGPDHPVTGGYPVIGVLDERSNDRCGQLRPGQKIRIRVRS